MKFVPFDRMRERVERGRNNSDAEYFDDLLLWGEFLTKVIAAGMVAAIDDDPDRLRYRQIHALIRADGIGDWAKAIDDVLTGPSAQFVTGARAEVQALTEKKNPPEWAIAAVRSMQKAAEPLTTDLQPLPQNPSLREWFRVFAYLRNKTRGHGAQGSDRRAASSSELRVSIDAIVDNLPLFQRPWAHLHQNLSGKYRVSQISGAPGNFADLRSKPWPGGALQDGLFVEFNGPRALELMVSDGDLSDFFSPNGGFNGRRYELLSYATGTIRQGDASIYLTPPTDLPRSDTRGGELDVIGETFSNLPPPPQDYISRGRLEHHLNETLADDRHAVITLQGPGGIGKTSLALTTLHRIAATNRYTTIVWFSARDVDLEPQGPRPVRPDVLNERDIAREYTRLVWPVKCAEKNFKVVEFMTGQLTKAEHGATLFVFDNFETVTSPVDLFRWLEASIRSPNKVLITTRLREFNGDYLVEVSGMQEEESEKLIAATAQSLRIENLLDSEYRRKIHEEANGHPYVIKVLLGETAKAGRAVSVPRLAADRDDILTALFERTFSNLDATGRRTFLTLCRWRSWVPTLGLKAVLLRAANEERMDIDAAIESLRKSSLIELRTVLGDGTEFVQAPLVASIFGQKKLKSDPSGAAIEADVDLLRAFGPTQESGLRHGISPHIKKIFAIASEAVQKDQAKKDKFVPLLEFVAGRYPPAWLSLAELRSESGNIEGWTEAIKCLRRYIEEAGPEADLLPAWSKIGYFSQRLNDHRSALHAWSQLAQAVSATVADVSEAANQINSILHEGRIEVQDRVSLVRPVIRAFERFELDASPTALSRLSWLHLNNDDETSARRVTERALAADLHNEHLVKLARRLRIEGF